MSRALLPRGSTTPSRRSNLSPIESKGRTSAFYKQQGQTWLRAQHEIRAHLRDVLHWADRLCAPAPSAGSGRPAAWAVAESRHCLLQYVKSVHRTAENIAAWRHPGVGEDSH